MSYWQKSYWRSSNNPKDRLCCCR
ncbi:unnamed protein product, partial [Rotaria magnacalcarata]